MKKHDYNPEKVPVTNGQDFIIACAVNYRHFKQSLRWGQFCYNFLFDLNRSLALRFCDNVDGDLCDCDPYYLDSATSSFFSKVMEEWK